MPDLQDATPRVLTPLDAPTILGRLRALGVFKTVPERYQHEIKAVLMDHCRSGQPQMWWVPFHQFATQMRFSHDKDTVPFRAVDTRVGKVGDVADRIIPIEDFARSRGFQLSGITDSDGDPVAASAAIEGDADLGVGWTCRGKTGVAPIEVRNGQVDVVALAGELNSTLRSCNLPLRVLLLPPHGPVWGLMWVDATTAVRAAQWGRLEYAGLDEPASFGAIDDGLARVEAQAPTRSAPQFRITKGHLILALLLGAGGVLYWASTLLEGGTEFDRVELEQPADEVAPDTAVVVE